ncbi:MAG: glycosyltransferase family 39 protein [Cyanobacteria bacterium J06632_22]
MTAPAIWRTLWPGLGLLLGLRLAYAFIALPNPDEAYYWLWGQQLDWSYYDHPPLHAWIQSCFDMVLGPGRWVLRLPTLLSSGLFFGTYFRICRYLYGPQGRLAFGVLLSALLASPLYFIYLAMAWQDQWLLAFGLLSAFELVQFLEGFQVNRPHYGQLYRAGLYLGLAGLCKYTAVLVGIAGLGVIVTQVRPLFKQGPFYGAVAIALLCQLPILIWNAQNDWLSVAYYLTRSIDSGSPGFQLKPLEVIGFWGLCGLILSPIVTWALWRGCRSRILAHCPPLYRAMAVWLFGSSTGILSAVALFSTALHYWNILAYLLLLPLLPTIFLKVGHVNSGLPQVPVSATVFPPQPRPPIELRPAWQHRRLFQLMQGLGIVVAAALLVNVTLLPLATLAGPEGDEESRILYGWEQIADTVQQQQTQLSLETSLVTTDYRSAALLAYALRHTNDRPKESHPVNVLALSKRKDQFDVWAARQGAIDQPTLVLADTWHPLTPQVIEQLGPLDTAVSIAIRRWGTLIKTYQLYVSQP